VHLYGAKMVTAQVVLIKNKLAGLTAQHAKAAVKARFHILDKSYGNNKRYFTRRSCMEGSKEIRQTWGCNSPKLYIIGHGAYWIWKKMENHLLH